MNKRKVKEARKAYFEAVLEKKDGSKRDLSKVKKILGVGVKIVVGLVLVALGFLFGDKGIEMFDRWTGNRTASETAGADEPAVVFADVSEAE